MEAHIFKLREVCHTAACAERGAAHVDGGNEILLSAGQPLPWLQRVEAVFNRSEGASLHSNEPEL